MCLIPPYILLPCQLFGIFPLHYKKNKCNSKKNLTFSRKVFAWNLALFIVRIVSTYVALAVDSIGLVQGYGKLGMDSSTTMFVIFVDTMSLNLLAITILVKTALKYQHFIKMTMILEEVEQVIRRKIRVVKTRAKLEIVFYYLGFTILLLLSLFKECITSSLNRPVFINSLPIIYCPLLTSYYYVVTLNVHFKHTAYMIAGMFKTVNEELMIEVAKQTRRMVKTTQLNKNKPVPGNFRFF